MTLRPRSSPSIPFDPYDPARSTSTTRTVDDVDEPAAIARFALASHIAQYADNGADSNDSNVDSPTSGVDDDRSEGVPESATPSVAELVARDKRERQQLRRTRVAERNERRRRHSSLRSRDMDRHVERDVVTHAGLRHTEGLRRINLRRRRRQFVPAHPGEPTNAGPRDVASRPGLAAPFEGLALCIYLVALPYVVISRWRDIVLGHSSISHAILVGVSLLWCSFIVQLLLDIRHLRRGGGQALGGSMWLAGLIVAMLTFASPSANASPAPRAPSSITHAIPFKRTAPIAPELALSLAPLSLALAVKRRNDQRAVEKSLVRIDNDEPSNQGADALLVESIWRQVPAGLQGLFTPSPSRQIVEGNETPVVILPFDGSYSYAREGGVLSLPENATLEDLRMGAVALHRGGVVFVGDHDLLLRHLATRHLRNVLVLYTGAASTLEPELRACCVTLDRPLSTPSFHRESAPFVAVLQPAPEVRNLVTPFDASLRRRCVEMTAYLTLHDGGPVSGERLRNRVIVHLDVDASARTLANTATTLRRSLGSDNDGARLHAVSSSGMYASHGVDCDYLIFERHVELARYGPSEDTAEHLTRALELVVGEPLSSVTKGFEWFIAEGHGAQLARDGEWAALCLAKLALERHDDRTAFWAIRKGLLLDPYSQALAEALQVLPRLREFGGNGASGTQYHPVSTSSTVAMGWAFSGLLHQVTQ